MAVRNKRCEGITLVELIVVISILGLIAVLSVPNYNRFMQNWKLNGEAQQFASAIRTARSIAIMKNIDVVFSFDDINNRYFYFEDLNGNTSLDANEYRSGPFQLSKDISISAYTLSNPTMTFGNKGNTRESGSITLRNANNNIKGIF